MELDEKTAGKQTNQRNCVVNSKSEILETEKRKTVYLKNIAETLFFFGLVQA